jgi:hypothetical protein
MEYTVWGRKPESEEWDETLLLSCGKTRKQAERVKQLAERDGWVHVRVAAMDMTSPPDFAGTIA